MLPRKIAKRRTSFTESLQFLSKSMIQCIRTSISVKPQSGQYLETAPRTLSVHYRPVQTGASHAIGFDGSAAGASPPLTVQTLTKKYLAAASSIVGVHRRRWPGFP